MMESSPLGKRPTRDHIFPRIKMRGLFGSKKHPPILIACYNCNRDKRADSLREWLTRVESRGNGDLKRLETLRAFVAKHPEWADLPPRP